MSERLPIQAKKASPATQKWHDFQLENKQATPKRLEEAAKFLTGTISITLTILLIGDEKLLQNADKMAVGFISISWLLSLLAAVLVIFPRHYAYRSDSAKSIQQIHEKVVRYKYILLVLSAALYFMALLGLVGVFLLR